MATLPTSRRRFWFRCVAVLLGLSAVAILEFGLRVADLGRLQVESDPYVGFNQVHPLFVPNTDGSRFEIAEERLKFFRPDSFAVDKSPIGKRIFCLGGSTVQGRPYSIETSFTTWLRLLLMAAEPERDWEVVNCGGVSYASYRLVPILEEVLEHKPDAIVVYTGHNEFLEERTYDGIKQRPKWVRNLHERVAGLRIYGLARQWVAPDPNAEITPVELNAEVDALLDYQGGMEEYHRDDEWRSGVVQHFDHNVRRMIRLAADANVPLLLVDPVSNLRDTPPFKSELPPHFNDQQKQVFSDLWEQAKEIEWDDPGKLAAVQKVLTLDPQHADALFLQARVLDSRGNTADAENMYRRAKDADVCPLRMLESMHALLQKSAAGSDTPLVEARQRFAAAADDGIPGNTQLIDHIHPRIVGHQRIAEALFDEIVGLNIVSPNDAAADRAKIYQANFDSLTPAYYLQAEERLRGLTGWATGRAEKLRLDAARTKSQ